MGKKLSEKCCNNFRLFSFFQIQKFKNQQKKHYSGQNKAVCISQTENIKFTTTICERIEQHKAKQEKFPFNLVNQNRNAKSKWTNGWRSTVDRFVEWKKCLLQCSKNGSFSISMHATILRVAFNSMVRIKWKMLLWGFSLVECRNRKLAFQVEIDIFSFTLQNEKMNSFSLSLSLNSIQL